MKTWIQGSVSEIRVENMSSFLNRAQCHTVSVSVNTPDDTNVQGSSLLLRLSSSLKQCIVLEPCQMLLMVVFVSVI